jgi:hypothetical protein
MNNYTYAAVLINISNTGYYTVDVTSIYDSVGILLCDLSYIICNKMCPIKKRIQNGLLVPFSNENYYAYSLKSLDEDIKYVQKFNEEKKLTALDGVRIFCITFFKFPNLHAQPPTKNKFTLYKGSYLQSGSNTVSVNLGFGIIEFQLSTQTIDDIDGKVMIAAYSSAKPGGINEYLVREI